MDPFTTHRFLHALESSGSVGPGTGWAPRYITVRDGAETVAVAPAYLKSHSQGEYVFDYGWANAFEQAGGRYYPKLQIAVPFTPVTGPRIEDDNGTAGGFRRLHGDTGSVALILGHAALTRSRLAPAVDNAHQGIVGRPLKAPAVHDHVVIEHQHRRLAFNMERQNALSPVAVH